MSRQPLPPGRHGLSPSFVATDQRERMLAACAELITEKGYAATTIDDIVRASRVSRKTFYEHFASKEDAFLAALDAATGRALERVRAAFASTDDWPEQVRRGLRALLEFVAAEPAFSFMSYVKSPLVDRDGRARYDASAAEFEVFTAPGFALAAHEVPREVGRMVGAGIQELISTCVRQGALEDVPGLLPAATYLCLVPFLGPTAAAREAGLEA
jgi:AcrR family transcriptional regulator